MERYEPITEEKWVAGVKAKKHSPEGLFAKGSSQEIADWALNSHGGNVQKAVAAINFYINRAGKGLSTKDKDCIAKAREIVSNKGKSK